MRVLNRLLGVGALVVLSAAVPVSPKAASGASAMMACSSGSGNISPCTQSVSTAPNTSGLHQTFTINNTSGNFVEGNVSCAFTAPVTSCSLDLTDYSLNGHTSQNEVVTFAVGATPGTGTVTVTTGGLIGVLTGTVNVTSAVAEAVTVTPDNQAVTSVGLQQNSYAFTVTNTGTLALTYDLTASCTGTATSCAVVAPTQISLGANGGSASKTVTYTAGAVGTASGTVKLTATSTSPSHVTDFGTIVETSGKSVATTPDAGAVTGPPATASHQVFKVTSTRSASTTFNLTIACTPLLTLCNTPASVVVPANSFSNVVTDYTTGANNTTGTVTLTAKQSGDVNNVDNGSVNVTVSAGGGGCGQDVVGGQSTGARGANGKRKKVAAPVNCFAPPVIQATPGSMTWSGKTVKTLIQYCSVDTNLDPTTIVVTWNGVNITSQMNPISPDTMLTSGFCGATPNGPHTGRSIGTVTLKPGANTLSSTVCTEGYNVCNTVSWTYTYVPLFDVSVTPDDSTGRVFASTASTLTYKVKRLDPDTVLATYNIAASCTGAAFPGSPPANCPVSAATVALRGHDSTNVSINWTTPANITTGRAVLTATLASNTQMKDSGSVNVNSSPPGVTITPDNVAQNAAPSAPNTAFFTVTNTGPVSATFNFTLLCTLNVSGCAVTPASQAIAGGASFTASIRYTAAGVGTTGMVRLYGTHSVLTTVKDSGWVNTTAATPAAIAVTNSGTGSTLERSLCLTVSAGHGAATECGDLRLAHALPGVRTKNKARSPTLLYNSAHAHPYPTLPFIFTLPAGAPVPDSVTVALTVGGVPKPSIKWTGADFNFARSRRAVLSYDALGDTSGVYTYSMQTKSWYGTSFYPSTVVNGEFALVNRRSSSFGAGWWMAGLEQLVVIGDGTLLWIAGDGSTRHYTSAGTNIWSAPKVDRPDTVKFANNQYTRYAEHGLRVIFDNVGNHIYTVNRISDTTQFTYTGRRLDLITAAPLSAGKQWAFTYDGAIPNTRLMSVTAPQLPGLPRVTTITTSGGRITQIQEPDLTHVNFGYTPGDTNRITSRTDRRGTVGTFTYNAAKKLVKDSVGMDVTDAQIVTTFRPYETVGLGPSSIDTALAYGLIDGPRTDVGDTTLFWLDNYGAPRKARNALGADTKIERTDPNFPALVTRVVSPNGRIARAAYDTRGNPLSSTDSSTCNATGCAVTSYQWDTKWDFATRVQAPLGEVTRMAYDATTGNRLWQQPDDNINYTARRVSFTYNDTTKLLMTVQEPVITQPQRVWYDAVGNPDSTQSPTGIKSYFYKDALGRDTLTKAPMDVAAGVWTLSRVAYNIADQDTVAKTFSSVGADSIRVKKTFDAEGNALTHTTEAWPDIDTITAVVHSWTYDRANRKTSEAPQGAAKGTEYFAYDAAGNVVTWTPRTGAAITTQYDALNRAATRVVPSITTYVISNYTFGQYIPADTQTFVYDVAGNMVQAKNLYARVSRTWNVNGSLATDTTRVRASVAEDPTYAHAYGTRYGYDLEGRRLWMKYPGAVANAGYDSVAYSYDATTGLLATVRDPYNHSFGYGYDNALRMVTESSLAETGSPAVSTRTYDDESRVTAQTMVKAAVQLGAHTITYSEASKVRSATFNVGGITGAPAMHYATLGPLTNSADNGTFFNDSIVSDPLGNARTKMHYGQTIDITTSSYEPGSAMLLKSSTVHSGSGHPADSTIYFYRAGSVWKAVSWKFAMIGGFLRAPNDTIYNRVTATSSFSVDNKLMLTVSHFDSLDATTHAVVGPQTYDETEEYRYDALGRRIWRRLERPDPLCKFMDKPSGCLSVVERTVWDGDQVLAEIRTDGGIQTSAATMECDGGCGLSRPALEGRVLYTNGAGLDHPLDVIRLDWYNDVIVPVYSWRGRAVDGICVNGSQFCTEFTWPARTESATFEDPPNTDPIYNGPVAWAGNIMDTQKDGSGLVYKRNRYYDPASGRFTQVDPIGLGGGLNAYGFGGGDQVSFIDPFGLDPKDLQSLIGQLAKQTNMTTKEVEDKLKSEQGLSLPKGTTLALGDSVSATAQKGNVMHLSKDGGTVQASGFDMKQTGASGHVEVTSFTMDFHASGEATTAHIVGTGYQWPLHGKYDRSFEFGKGIENAATKCTKATANGGSEPCQ